MCAMKSDKFSLLAFFKRYPNEEAAVEYFEKLRWGDGVRCPHCGSVHVSKCKHPMPYRCKECRKHFSVRVGTILEDSKLPLQKWLLAIYILTNAKKGISSIQLAEYLECTQKTAWFLAHRIREAWQEQLDKFSGIVEVDETYIGGTEKNKHRNKKQNAGRGAVGKTPVVGVRSREGKVKAGAVASVDCKTLSAIVYNNVTEGATLCTDNFSGYNTITGYNHYRVNHSAGEYVRDNMHTNGIEGFWSILKRGLLGVYHKWSVKHLNRYVGEFVIRYNSRENAATDRIQSVILGGIGRHLSYKELIYGTP